MTEADEKLLELCDGCSGDRNLAEIKELVEVKKADVNAMTLSGMTPLAKAMLADKSTETVKYLIEKGARTDIILEGFKSLLRKLFDFRYILPDFDEKAEIIGKAMGILEEDKKTENGGK